MYKIKQKTPNCTRFLGPEKIDEILKMDISNIDYIKKSYTCEIKDQLIKNNIMLYNKNNIIDPTMYISEYVKHGYIYGHNCLTTDDIHIIIHFYKLHKS